MRRQLISLVIVLCVNNAVAQNKALKIDEQGYMQNSFVSTNSGMFYVAATSSTSAYDLKFVEAGNNPKIISSGYWDFGSQVSAGAESVFFKASNGAAANAKAVSPFLLKSYGSVVKLHAFDEPENVVIDAAVKAGDKIFYKVGTTARKAQIWVTDLISGISDTAYAIDGVDVINTSGNSKYRMAGFKNELYLFTTIDSLHFDVFKTTNLEFKSLSKITNFNTVTADSMNYMIAGENKLFMFYKSGTANKLYSYDGTTLNFIGLTAASLGVTDVITIGDTLYYSANKTLYMVVGKDIVSIPAPGGATTTINWVRAVGSKVAFIATDATYGKEARLFDPKTNSVTVFDVTAGTPSTTGITYNVPLNNTHFVFYGSTGSGYKFYVADGINTQTIDLDGESTIASGATPTVANGYVYFLNSGTPNRKLFALNISDIGTNVAEKYTNKASYYSKAENRIYIGDSSKSSKITIYDLTGRTVRTHTSISDFCDVQGLKSGIYIARINERECLKFIIE